VAAAYLLRAAPTIRRHFMSDGERMTAPLYDASVPVIRQMLGGLAELLR
jgi:hypothetical protein